MVRHDGDEIDALPGTEGKPFRRTVVGDGGDTGSGECVVQKSALLLLGATGEGKTAEERKWLKQGILWSTVPSTVKSSCIACVRTVCRKSISVCHC